MARYGQKGGDGPTRGKKATTYLVTLPCGAQVKKRTFDAPSVPTGYAYQHQGVWYLAAVSEPGQFTDCRYTQCHAALAPAGTP